MILDDRWHNVADDPRLGDPRVMEDVMTVHNEIVADLLAYLGFTFEPHSPDFVAVSRNGRTCFIPQHKPDLPHPPIIQGPGVNKTPALIAQELATYLMQAD